MDLGYVINLWLLVDGSEGSYFKLIEWWKVKEGIVIRRGNNF